MLNVSMHGVCCVAENLCGLVSVRFSPVQVRSLIRAAAAVLASPADSVVSTSSAHSDVFFDAISDEDNDAAPPSPTGFRAAGLGLDLRGTAVEFSSLPGSPSMANPTGVAATAAGAAPPPSRKARTIVCPVGAPPPTARKALKLLGASSEDIAMDRVLRSLGTTLIGFQVGGAEQAAPRGRQWNWARGDEAALFDLEDGPLP